MSGRRFIGNALKWGGKSADQHARDFMRAAAATEMARRMRERQERLHAPPDLLEDEDYVQPTSCYAGRPYVADLRRGAIGNVRPSLEDDEG